jgi:hypothetical protein
MKVSTLLARVGRAAVGEPARDEGAQHGRHAVVRGATAPPQVVICRPDDVVETAGPGPWSLWYLGRDYRRLLALSAGRDDCEVVAVGALANAVAGRLRHELIELDKRLASGRFRLAWLASDLAERNPYTSDLVLDACRVVALIEAVRCGGRHLVVVDDRRLGRAVAQCCRRAGFTVEWRGSWRTRAYVLQAGIRNHANFIADWLRERRATARHRCDPTPLVERDPLLMRWCDGTEAETDRFFGPLHQWLVRAGFRPGHLDNPTTSLRTIEEIAEAVARRAAAEPRILVGALAGFGDLLRAYLQLALLPFAVRRRLVVADVDLTPLLRLGLGRELMSPRLVRAALYAGLAPALERRGVHPGALVYTFENQPWEKAMLAGFRRHLPATVLIGVHHAPFDESFIGCHPSSGQWTDGTAPDLVLALGEELRERLVRLGAPPDRVRVGGALRYPDMRADKGNERAREPGRPKHVFVACSMDLHEAFELSYKAIVATEEIAGLRLLVGLHPMVSPDFRAEIRALLGPLADLPHVAFVDGGAAKWMPDTDVLLYESSSTVFEAAAAGVPAIHVANSCGLDLDVMAGTGLVKCRGVDDLRDGIRRLLGDAELQAACVAAARDYIRRCFAVPQADVWVGLVGDCLAGRLERGAGQ